MLKNKGFLGISPAPDFRRKSGAGQAINKKAIPFMRVAQ
jgi:hypothetical protein